LDTRFAGSYLAEDNGFLKVIKICSITSFGGKVKPSIPCYKILWHVKEPYRYEKIYFIGKIQGHFLPSLSYFPTRCQRGLVDESGMIIELRWRCEIDQK
jgi:hypothetical protein